VTTDQMIKALVAAVESPPPDGTQRVIDVPGIRAARLGPFSSGASARSTM